MDNIGGAKIWHNINSFYGSIINWRDLCIWVSTGSCQECQTPLVTTDVDSKTLLGGVKIRRNRPQQPK